MMNNYMFYFTGTGNSLSCAKQISRKIGETTLVNIAKVYKNGYCINEADTVGIIIPVYVFRSPLLVEAFIKKLQIKHYNYLYIVLVHGGAPFAAVAGFKKQLERVGLRVDAGYEVLTPDNYLEGANPPSQQESKDLLITTREQLIRIADKIKSQEQVMPKTVLWQKLLGTVLSKSFRPTTKKAAKKFLVTDQCSGCGICTRLCPKNIIKEAKGKKPRWLDEGCEMCFSCINLCPENAIEIGTKTKGKNRYKNPDITLSELMLR